jgi:hypothetical protein
MRRIVLISIIMLGALVSKAQSPGVSIEPAAYSDPSTELKIIVNLNELADQSSVYVQNLIADADANLSIYFWTWKPYEFPPGSPKENGIGAQAWKNSNELLVMTKESDRVYSFTLTPTAFYEVSPATVYMDDIHFLVKPKDGGGFGAPDRKSPDLSIDITNVGIQKIATNAVAVYPQPANETLNLTLSANDLYTIIDLAGNRIAQGNYSGVNNSISTATWPNGIYILQVSNSNGISSQKVCIVH